jgi:hypothetical protein
MEILPVLTLKEKIDTNKQSALEESLSKFDADTTIYILDIYGINKDKPNLCIYQRLSRDFELWIDSGPRNLGDVVDVFLAGANKITIRRSIWHKIDIQGIREVSENKIYIDIDSKTINNLNYYNVDGLVNFKTREEFENAFKLGYFLKKIASKTNIYSYESDIKNLTYWKKQGINNFLVDIDKIGEFKKYEF